MLAANYIARACASTSRCSTAGENGLVAHECILDLRPITKATGVTVDDVAKRLIDYGFHAPTMCFPVAGTLMVEPTESEDLGEIDRFVDAMIAIRARDRRRRPPASGRPTTTRSSTRRTPPSWSRGEWAHPYTREQACYPDSGLRRMKYWSPVRRIEGAYGDRNLVVRLPAGDGVRRRRRLSPSYGRMTIVRLTIVARLERSRTVTTTCAACGPCTPSRGVHAARRLVREVREAVAGVRPLTSRCTATRHGPMAIAGQSTSTWMCGPRAGACARCGCSRAAPWAGA